MPNQTPVLNDVFHALADPSRRLIVERLTQGPASVSDLAKPLPMALPSVVQHLRVLESSGLIRSEKTGRVRTCHIRPAPLTQAEKWIGQQRAMWEARLDQLEDYLRTLQGKEKSDGDST